MKADQEHDLDHKIELERAFQVYNGYLKRPANQDKVTPKNPNPSSFFITSAPSPQTDDPEMLGSAAAAMGAKHIKLTGKREEALKAKDSAIKNGVESVDIEEDPSCRLTVSIWK